MMDVAAKLPTMADTALTMLYANAERLERSGTSAQKTAAAELLPSIKAELAARVAAKMALAKAKAPTTKHPVSATKPPAVKQAAKAKPPAVKRVARVKAPAAKAPPAEAPIR